MDSAQELIDTATGYVELGMFSDAWNSLEMLPPEEKTTAAALDIRLRILTALAQWELGDPEGGGAKGANGTTGEFHRGGAGGEACELLKVSA